MARSMTGFGRAITAYEGEQVTVEISAVNHRYLECSFRLPPVWSSLEPPLREILKKDITRGKINVSVRREYGPMGRVRVRLDEEAAANYAEAGRRLSDLLNTTETLSLDRLVTLEGVFLHEDSAADMDAVQSMLESALSDALRNFDQTRSGEGDVLVKDMGERVNIIAGSLSRVEARIPLITGQYHERLIDRVKEIAAEAGVKEERIALEVAMMADRMDITEEIVRLRAHLDHARELFGSTEPIGRDMNFLVQEMQREVNTMGSKLRDVDVGREVLLMKSEVERLREQIQNIE